MAGWELLAELPHSLVGDPAVEHGQPPPPASPMSAAATGTPIASPSSSPIEPPPTTVSPAAKWALAELDAPGVVLDHDGSVLQLERLLLARSLKVASARSAVSSRS